MWDIFKIRDEMQSKWHHWADFIHCSDVLTVDFEQTNEQTNDIWKPQESRNWRSM